VVHEGRVEERIRFLIAAMDHPFLGEFSVGPDAFVALRQQMPT
jgi:hypothetical protein